MSVESFDTFKPATHAGTKPPADVLARFDRIRADQCKRNAKAAPAAWREMQISTRAVLVAIATARRDTAAAARQPWESFTEGERVAIGALARQLVADMRGAAGMLVA